MCFCASVRAVASTTLSQKGISSSISSDGFGSVSLALIGLSSPCSGAADADAIDGVCAKWCRGRIELNLVPRPVIAVVTAQIGAGIPISAVQRQRLFGTAEIQNSFEVFAVLVLQGFERGPLDSHVDWFAAQIGSLQVLAGEHIVSFCHG